jgi:hypothetical protein
LGRDRGDGGDVCGRLAGRRPLNLKQAWQAYKARKLRSQYRVLEGGRKTKKKYLN